jgi:hypothetical protein
MKTFSIRTSSGGTERIEGDCFIVGTNGILEIITLSGHDRENTIGRVIAMYADKCWHSIKEVQ